MAAGPLRKAVDKFIDENPATVYAKKTKDDIKTRFEKAAAVAARAVDYPARIIGWRSPMILINLIWYVCTGTQKYLDIATTVLDQAKPKSASEELANFIRAEMSNPNIAEITEILGTVVTEPVLSLFEEFSNKQDIDPHEFSRRFHGTVIGLTSAGGIMDTALETFTGGQVEGAGRMLESLYWNLGLGFLGWQTLAPLLSEGLQPGLNRYYRKLYRPARFTAADLRDLYALGEVTEGQLEDFAKEEGWRDQDIARWKRLAYKKLSEGEVWQLYKTGNLSKEDTTKRLRGYGYDPAEIPLLYKVKGQIEEEEPKAFTASTARSAYKKGIINSSELRDILTGLNYQAREVELIIKVDQLAIENAIKDLSVNQIALAWSDGVITETEARHWLGETKISKEGIDIIIRTWKAETAPVFRLVNSGSVVGAYVEGIYSKAQAQKRLTEIGYADEDAKLELQLAEARNPLKFGAPPPPVSKQLTPGVLSNLVLIGLITPDQMRGRLLEIDYTENDARLLSEAARVRAQPEVIPLPQVSIERAYIAGVLTRDVANQRLLALGLSAQSAKEILDTVELENAEAFGAPGEEKVKYLSSGVLEDLLIAGLITGDEMYTRLLELFYSEEDANLLTTRATQLAQPVIKVISRSDVERAYIVGVFDRPTASARLADMGFDEQDIKNILDVVEAENPAIFAPEIITSVRQPSITALVAAVQKTLITEEEYFTRSNELGYTSEDARMYLGLARKTEGKVSKELSVSQVTGAYKAGIMGWGEAMTRVESMGYSNSDATLIMRLAHDRIQNTSAWLSMLSGGLSAEDCIYTLIGDSYSDNDILEAFSSLSAPVLAALGINLDELRVALGQIPGGV